MTSKQPEQPQHSQNETQLNQQQQQQSSSTKLKLKVVSSNLPTQLSINSSNNNNNISNNNNNSNSNNNNNDQSFGISNYVQSYDRELDSDQEEPIGFEEQFILKIPNSETNLEFNKFIELVKNRKEINSNDEKIFFKFKDSRRGIFNIGNKIFPLKLVDLPCVIESQKTFDNKHMFKIADICQMILVEDTPITDESTVTRGNFNIEDFIYPHGLTPPLHHVRKRRFRKRLNKRTIETVERAVERLLEEDSRADQVIIDIVDNVRDLSDSEGEDYQPPKSATIQFGNQPQSKIVYNKSRSSIISLNNQKPFNSPTIPQQSLDSIQQGRKLHSKSHTQDGTENSREMIAVDTPFGDSIGAPTPAGEEFEDRLPIDFDDEGSIDSDLAAEIEAGLIEGATDEEAAVSPKHANGNQDDDSEDLFGDGDNDDDEDDEEEEEDDDDEETNEMIEDKQRIRLLQGELKDLEVAINRKRTEISKAGNLILRKRFEEALKKLIIESDSKKNQLNSTQNNLQNALLERKNQNQKSDQQQQQKEQQQAVLGELGKEIESVTIDYVNSNQQESNTNQDDVDLPPLQNIEDNPNHTITESSSDHVDHGISQSQMDLGD